MFSLSLSLSSNPIRRDKRVRDTFLSLRLSLSSTTPWLPQPSLSFPFLTTIKQQNSSPSSIRVVQQTARVLREDRGSYPSMQEEEGPPTSDELAAPITVRLPSGSSAGNGFGEIAAERESGGGSPAGNRWPRQETMALLKIRSDMDPLFQEATLKAPLWEEVSRKLRDEGFQRSAKKCREKFENVFKYYKRTKEARAGKSYRFFSQLEALRTAAATPALPPPIVSISRSATMVNIEASSSAAAAPSQYTMVSVTDPRPPPAVVAPITTPTIVPPPTDAADGPSSSSNTSSYSGTESEGEDEGEASRKRKRKLRGGDEAPEESRKMMAFFEGLIQKVMDQQEKMLQRFLEAIERREQNRMIREEAWRRQEKSRLSREHELAAQERAAAASRDDAIISFIQKLTGQKIHIPPPPQPLHTTADPAEETPISPPPPPAPQPEDHDQPPKETALGSSSRTTMEPISSSRWPKSEVHALIKLRSGMESRYQESIPKGPLWEDISAGMLRLGYNRSAKRCKEKWENINKYFKKVKENSKNRREDAKTCPYFHQLDALYRHKLIGSSSSAAIAAQTLPTDDQLVIISPTTAITKQLDDRLSFFEQGSSSVSPVKKPEDIVKKKIEQAIVEPETIKKKASSYQFRIHYKMPRVLGEGTGRHNFFAMAR